MATRGIDYTTDAQRIVIAPGSTRGGINVLAVQDDKDELDEAIVVDITSVTNGPESGTQQVMTTILDDDDPLGLLVTSLVPQASGFRAEFSHALDTSTLNLYDTQSSGFGPADVILQGAARGVIGGSLVVDPSARSVTFVKTGGPLEPDTYTVTLRSPENGFKSTTGLLLDGNRASVAYDDFTNSFTVSPPPSDTLKVSISLPDLVRGPGQDVNLTADTTTGIPLSVSEGAGVRTAEIQIKYDPTLLVITSATAGEAMPAGVTVVLDISTAGTANLVFTSPADFPAGSNVLVYLQASIPAANASANYRRQQVLDIQSVEIADTNAKPLPAVADDALHLVSYFADVSGNGRINASDASQVARFAALLENGFAGSLSTAPILVGDISGNGRINAADASLLAQFAALIPVSEIPPIPGGIVITGLGVYDLGSGLPRLRTDQPPLNDRSPSQTVSAEESRDPLDIPFPVVDRVMIEWGDSELNGDGVELLPPLDGAIEELLSAGATLRLDGAVVQLLPVSLKLD